MIDSNLNGAGEFRRDQPRNWLDVVDVLEPLPAAQREARLAGMSLSEADRRQVEACLRNLSHTGGFLAAAAAAIATVSGAGTLADGGDDGVPGAEVTREGRARDRELVMAPRVDGYSVTGRLGEGGMGVVWRAVQLSTRRPVALKVMSAAGFGSERARQRFNREVELTSKLEHPHIARLYDSGAYQGVYFYAMELVDGSPLDRFVGDHRLNSRQVLELLGKIASAVQYAHQRGVIHRDLKPSNILVDGGGQPRVLDFGLAKDLLSSGAQAISLDGELAGTPAYMSPEQAAGRQDRVDTRSDVYSLGVILYGLLVGESPHDLSGTYLEVVRRVAEREVRRPRALNPTINAEIESLLLKALARDVDERYSSAGALADDITNYLAGEPLHARAPTLSYLVRKRLRKHWLSLSVTGLVLGALIGAGAFSYVRVNNERQHALSAQADAEARRIEGDRQRASAEQRLAESLVAQADGLRLARRWTEANTRYAEAVELSRRLGRPALAAKLGLWAVHRESPSALSDMRGHTGIVLTVALSADGHVALSGSEDGTARLWETTSGTQLRLLCEGQGPIRSVALSPDRTTAVVGGNDGSIRVWDLRTHEPPRSLRGHRGPVHSVALSPDMRVAASGGEDHAVKIWDLQTTSERCMLGGHPATVQALAFSHDGSRLASGSIDGTIQLWDQKTYKPVHRLMAAGRADSKLRCIAFSPDDSLLRAGGVFSGLQQWRTVDGQSVEPLESMVGPIFGMADSPDGRFSACGGSTDSLLSVWQPSQPRDVRTFQGHTDRVMCVAISTDGRFVVSGGADYALKLWSTGSPRETRVLGAVGSSVSCVACSPDGRLVAGARDDGSIALCDVTTGKTLGVFTGHRGAVRSATFSPDGQSLISSSFDGNIIRWSVATQSVENVYSSDAQPIWHASFSRDCRRALAARDDGSIQFWDLEHQRVIATYKVLDQPAWSVALATDGRTALCGGAGVLVQVGLSDGHTLRSFTGHHLFAAQCALSPDGRTAISSDSNYTIGLWEVADGLQAPLLSGHTSLVQNISVSEDANYAVTSSEDGTAKVWDLGARREVHTLFGHQSRVWDAVLHARAGAPPGTVDMAVTGGEDGTVRAWDFARVAEYEKFEKSVVEARRRLSRAPGDGAANLIFGRWYEFRGEWDLALEFFNRARKAGFDVPPHELGQCHWMCNQPEMASRAFAKALAVHDGPEAYLQLCLRALSRERHLVLR